MRISRQLFLLGLLASTACASGAPDYRPGADAQVGFDAGTIDATTPDATVVTPLPDAAPPPRDMAAPPQDMPPDAPPCTPHSCSDVNAECGTIDNGCGTPITCATCPGTSMCAANKCVCAADSAEVNNTRPTAKDIGTYTDTGDESMTFTMYSLASMTDEDWYKATVRDEWGESNPQLTVTLDNIPTGQDYDLQIVFVCDEGTDASTCSGGAPDAMYGTGCRSTASGSVGELTRLETECDGDIDEHGTLFIRITAKRWLPMCAAYRMTVSSD